jgi:hypothetical protein
MKGEKPVNTNRFTKADVATQEMKAKHSGTPSGKVTRNFMASVRNSLIEHRGGTITESPAAAPVGDVKKYRDGLVNAGKVLVASLNAIDFAHSSKPHDLNNLILIEENLRNLAKNLTMFPELRKTIKGRVKFPVKPHQKQRSGP